ncbi:MAG: TerB family tellurite resistance protein [Acidobacteriota bacterium]
MSLWTLLGFDDQPKRAASAETEVVRKVVQALDNLEESQARFIAAFGYILGRVANADLKISPEETTAMEAIIREHGNLPPEQSLIVVEMAKKHAQLFGGTENFLVSREFDRIATREQKLALLDCLFAVAAAEGHISVVEDNEIKQVSQELHLDHPEFIAVRSRWKDRLGVFQKPS